MVTPPRVFGVLLYDYVSSLDFMGPLAFINNVPGIEILLIHDTISPILSGTPEGLPGGPFAGPTLLPSCTLESAPRLDALLIPGGSGSFTMNLDSKWTDFIAKVSPDLQYLLTVCNGTVLLAKAGVLDGKRATTNKAVFSWVASHSSKVEWVRDARWVVDGKFWTSSGVEAGTDMGYAFVASVFGEPIASEITTMLEYSPNKDPSFDPFAAVHPDEEGNLSSLNTKLIPPPVSNPNPIITRWGILVFDGVVGLDIAATSSFPEYMPVGGPFLGIASFITPNQLLEPIEMASRASNGGQRLLPTQSLLTTTPQSESLDVLIVPGLATPGPFPHQQELVAFIRAAFPYLKHIMSIGTGSMLLAEAGILDGRSATTCNALFDSATVPYRQENRAITWKTGRWVRDGNVWTASGSASALDAGAALCVEMYGEVATRKATDFMEYLPRTNSSDDPFAKAS